MSRLDVSDEEVTTLREILDSERKQLLHGDAKSDSRDYRSFLVQRLAVVERLLEKLTPASTQSAMP
jgi:hypothetical protein